MSRLRFIARVALLVAGVGLIVIGPMNDRSINWMNIVLAAAYFAGAIYLRPRVQNRTEMSIQARHYDRWTYLPEKTQALNMWASEIERILAIPAMMNAAE